MTEQNPFMGPRPYGVAEAKVFFGRERAGRQLAEQIELYPMVAVVSPSGIGKTSLLRAAVIPGLERSGLLPVYMRPDPKPESGNDGALALLDGRMEEAIIRALLPDVALELKSLALVREQWGDIALQEAKENFDDLSPADAFRATLLDPGTGVVEQLSLTARYLNGTYAEAALAEQWNLLEPALGAAFCERAGASALAAILSSPEVRDRGRSIGEAFLASLVLDSGTDAQPDETTAFRALRSLAEAGPGGFQLIRPDGDTELQPRIVLVIDQFEQVFTLSHPDNRDRLLTVLAALADAALPIHIVLSLRKEWFADLVRYLTRSAARPPLQQFVTYHLDSMTHAEAQRIMVDVPASIGAQPISTTRQTQLWDELSDGQMLDPVTLSIACHELFELVREGDEEAAGDAGALSVEDLLGNYLERALLSLTDPADKTEAIDMLGEIAGSGTSRLFITESQLLGAPLRDPERRRRVLQELQRLFLIRGDNPRRESDKLYDIMHERLIEPVRQLVASLPRINQLRHAAQRITQPAAAQLDLDMEDLSIALNALDHLNLDSRSAGILLCGVLQLDPRSRDKARVKRLALECGEEDGLGWCRTTAVRLARIASGPAPADRKAADRLASEWWLSESEIERSMATSPSPSTVGKDGPWLVINTLLRHKPSERTRARLRRTLDDLRSAG